MTPISVLTLTYNRYEILQEALQSFVLQGADDCEMIIINDQAEVDYVCHIPNVRIFNVKTRFPSIFDKILFGFQQAKNEHVYRLDDDDLLAEDNLKVCQHCITDNPGYDVYRSKEVQFTTNTTYMGLFGSVNNGNIFTKKYVASLGKKQLSVNEDQYMLFDGQPRVYTFDFPSMIYRWGMGTYHISGMSITDPAEVNNRTDKFGPMEKGTIRLEPKWKTNYYEIVKGVANG